jgi:hypothetical protein
MGSWVVFYGMGAGCSGGGWRAVTRDRDWGMPRCMGPRRGVGFKARAGRFPFSYSPSISFIYSYANLDLVFQSKIQMYYMSLNGCATTTIQHTEKISRHVMQQSITLLGF